MIRQGITDYSFNFKSESDNFPGKLLDSTILIVDDNPENIFSLKTLLEQHKFRVDAAGSGEEALKKVLRNSYALIILDVQMPEMDGFEVAEALSGSSKAKEIPIIFLSAVNTHKKFITKGYDSGGIDYVTKPFDPEILLLKVKTFIRLYEQTRELMETQRVLRKEIEFKSIAEASLKQSVDELRSILESIQQIAFTTDRYGAIEFVNHQWAEYSESKNEFPKTKCDYEAIEDCVSKAIGLGKPYVCETYIHKPNSDECHFFLLGMTPVFKGESIVKWVGIFTDIHTQKMAEQVLEKKVDERTVALQEMNKELEARNGELQQFAFVASHDLQEPLRKIQVFSTIVKDKYLNSSEEAQIYIDRVITSSERMRSLINDLLSYSRLAGDDEYVKYDLKTIIESVVNDLEMSIKTKGATVTVGEMPAIEAIGTQISQAFQNLISNALKFSKDDEPPIIAIAGELVESLSPDAPVDADGKFCRITVKDNGIGFNQEYAERIFTIFQRLSSRKKYEGTGIGLAIVRKVLDRHKGLIVARSEEGKGATFILVLPLKQYKQ